MSDHDKKFLFTMFMVLLTPFLVGGGGWWLTTCPDNKVGSVRGACYDAKEVEENVTRALQDFGGEADIGRLEAYTGIDSWRIMEAQNRSTSYYCWNGERCALRGDGR